MEKMISFSLMSRRWAVATTNINGWAAKPPGKLEMRKVLLMRMLREHKVGIAAVQELHITSESVLQSQKIWAERLAAVPTPVQMRGGVLLMWQSPTWKLSSVEYIGHKLILADLMHVTRDTVKVLAGHLHHDAPVRQKQWEQLGQKLTGTSVPLITLCDHHSHVLPGADSEGLRESKLKVQLSDQAQQ